MVSDKEILDWFNKQYPEYAGNLELAKLLWKNKFGQQKKEYTKMKARNIESSVDEFVELEGMVAQIRENTYLACPKCGASLKKGCEHLDAGEEPIEKYIYELKLGDDTGVATALIISKDPVFVELGDRILVRGKVTKRFSEYLERDEIKISVYSYEIIEKAGDISPPSSDDVNLVKASDVVKDENGEDPRVKQILAMVKNGKKTKAFIERVLKYRGMEWKDIEKFVEVYKEKDIEYVRVVE